jgi:hypothetical protein
VPTVKQKKTKKNLAGHGRFVARDKAEQRSCGVKLRLLECVFRQCRLVFNQRLGVVGCFRRNNRFLQLFFFGRQLFLAGLPGK